MATQNFKKNLLLNLEKGKYREKYREGKKNPTLVCSLLRLKRAIKNVRRLQPASSVWRPLAFLPVTLSKGEERRGKGRGVGKPHSSDSELGPAV